MLFADWDLWPLIKLAIAVVIGAAWVIKQVTGRTEEAADEAPRPRPLAGPRDPGREMMGQEDIDQFLEEVIGRRPARRPQAAPPPVPGQERVVVLRPSARPAAAPPARQQESRPRSRPGQRRPERMATPVESAVGPPPVVTAVAPGFTESVQKEMGQAAAATQSAGALKLGVQQTAGRRAGLDPASVIAMLKAPADLRRAVILSEVLGPPRARRRR